MIVIGLAIMVLAFGLGYVFEDFSGWIIAIGVPIGAFIIFKGRERLGLKNKHFGDN